MHSLLENYLSEVARQLDSLPQTRRNEELKEMRQHLLSAVIVNREFGQSEEEAVTSALRQFGPPQEATEGLIQAWRREQKLRRRDFWGATLCVLLTVPAMWRALDPLNEAYWNWAIQHRHWNPTAPDMGSPWFWVFFAFQMALCGLGVGVVSGTLFPRRAAAGAGLAAFVYGTVAVTRWIYSALHIPDGAHSNGFGPLNLVYYIAALTVFSTATVCGARVVSRWRERGRRLVRV